MTLSQIIVTSRYLKSGTQKSKNKRRNYTKYIATRETVEVRDQNIMDRNDNATKNQEQLLNDLLSDFPEAKKYLEYEDYTVNPTVENASELISTIIERNADVIGNRQNFVGYGLGTEQDYEKAFEWFLKSAQEGNKFAQYSLANLYYYGNGVEKDLSQAFLWYRKSSEQGQPYAPYAVAQMYDKGEYVSQSEETAQRYYKVALSGFLELESKGQADDNLYYKLGAMYKKGLGTEIDIPKAIEYFEKSAENMWSTYQLGRLYLFGAEGVEKDKEKAAQWLTKSANDGNEYAQNMLDDMGHFENMLLRNTVMGLFVNLSRCIEDDYTQKYKSVRRTVDSRLRRMIRLKKQDMGIKENFTQSLD